MVHFLCSIKPIFQINNAGREREKGKCFAVTNPFGHPQTEVKTEKDRSTGHARLQLYGWRKKQRLWWALGKQLRKPCSQFHCVSGSSWFCPARILNSKISWVTYNSILSPIFMKLKTTRFVFVQIISEIQNHGET